MLAVGVDLAAENTKTCMAVLDVQPERTTVVSLENQVGNERIVEASAEAHQVGIDCPFGWPVAFVDFVTEHRHGPVSPREGTPIDWRRLLAYRDTDRFVTAATGLRPLSVAADRIAHAAMRCAALLAELEQAGMDVDRSGAHGKVVEVYPAASLFRWHLVHRRYKRTENAQHLDELVKALLSTAPWLDLGDYGSACTTNDDAFDAVIAGLTAAAAAAGLTSPPPSGTDGERARTEGWIALPDDDSLRVLPAAVARLSAAFGETAATSRRRVRKPHTDV